MYSIWNGNKIYVIHAELRWYCKTLFIRWQTIKMARKPGNKITEGNPAWCAGKGRLKVNINKSKGNIEEE